MPFAENVQQQVFIVPAGAGKCKQARMQQNDAGGSGPFFPRKNALCFPRPLL